MKKNNEAVEVVEVVKSVAELMEEIKALKEKLGNKGEGRKGELLKILKEGRISIKDVAEKMGISERNVSSLKCYLKNDGWNFGKDSKGRIYIEEE